MGELFISYSRADQTFVDRLVGDLEDRGFSVWMDRQDIRGGAQWRAQIAQAIRACEAFLVVLSPSSTDSMNVGRELELAADNRRPIIPIVSDTCAIPAAFEYQLAGLHRIEFCGGHDPRAAFEQLVSALQGISRSGKTAAAPARSRAGDAATPAAASSRGFEPQRPAPSAAAPPGAPAALPQLLPGRWQVQLHSPVMGVANITLDFAAHGMFQGQLMKPFGATQVAGQWQVGPMNQLMMSGQETNGFQTIPYATMIQLNVVGPTDMTGITVAGEQVVMRRVG